jgi:SusD family.
MYPHYEYELSILGNDFCPTNLSGKDIEQQNLYRWQDKSISSFSSDVWLSFYSTIATCDVLLEREDLIITENPAEQNKKEAIISEALTLKALCYFNLLRLFAPAYDINPKADGIIIKNRVGIETQKRSSIEDCITYIKDLLNKSVLCNNNPTQNGWLSKNAAIYLLSEVELYSGNYDLAAKHSETLLNNLPDELFSSADNYQRLWQQESFKGRIFAFNNSNPYYSSIQYDEKSGDYFALSPIIKYQQNDIRKESNSYPFYMDGKERILLGKYNMNNKTGRNTSYINIMRYAGSFFIGAEAYCRNGEEEKGRNLINKYLSLCSAKLLSKDITNNLLISSILNEKYKEFAGEGVNYFDLKRVHNNKLIRYNKWGDSANSTIEEDDYRWSFPFLHTNINIMKMLARIMVGQ